MHLNSLFPCTIASRRYHHSNICSRLSITTSVCQLSSIWTTTGASYKFVLNARFRMLQQLLFMVFHHRCNKSQALHHSSVNKQNLSGSAGVLALFLLLFFIYFSVDSFIILFSAFLETKRWRYERRRREYRGAEGGGVWGGVSLSPPRDGSEEGAVPPQIFFSFWSLKSLVLLHFECNFCKFVYDGWVASGQSFWFNCSGKQREPARS